MHLRYYTPYYDKVVHKKIIDYKKDKKYSWY